MNPCVAVQTGKTRYYEALVQKIIPQQKLKVKRSTAGLGLFADATIRPGERIEYIGKRLSKEAADKKGGKYLFEVNKGVTIDGTTRKNLARYINHSCKANCEARVYQSRVFIVAVKTIKPGEELSYDYGEEYFNEHIKPFGCRCPAHR